MRIALLTHQFPGVRLGGIGAYTLQAAAALAAAGHEPHVFTLSVPADVPLPPGVTLHRVPDLAARVADGRLPDALAAAVQAGGEAVYRAALGALLCDEVRRLHAQTPLDILEAAEYESLGLPLLLDRVPGLPVVTHIHSGSALRRVGNALPSTPDALVFEALEFASLRLADGLCAATARVEADTRGLVELATPVARIPLPFTFDEARPHVPPDLRGPILYIGRLEALKGVEVLTQALATFLPRHPAARVVLAGPDTNTAAGNTSMAAWIRRTLGPLVSQVEFTGEQNRAQLDAWLARCSFVVLPSLLDNFPYVACETLAAGRAVLVSDGIGATELVGDAGVTFARGDAAALAAALEQVVREPSRMSTLSQRAYERARGVLSSHVTVPARVAFYQQVIAHPARPDPGAALAGIPPAALAACLPALLQLTAALAGAPLPSTRTPGTRLRDLAESYGAGRPMEIVLYGAGRHTARLLSEKYVWEARGHRVVGLIDDHPRFAATRKHLGLPICSLAEFLKDLPDPHTTLVVLSTDTFEEQFWERTARVRAAGMPVAKLYE